MAEKKTKKKNVYLEMLQSSINIDIQAIKTGSLDEELLRSRMEDNPDPTSPNATLILWLCALCTGVIDDLSVAVMDNNGEPAFIFQPEFREKSTVTAPVLHLHVPGPKREAQPELPAQVPSGTTQSDTAVIST